MPLPGPSSILKLTGVSKRYDSPAADGAVAVLRELSLEIQRGKSLAVVGPSGSGKSTLLHIIGGLDRPDQGEVLLDGRNLLGLDEKELASVRNREVGFVFQAHYLLPQCTALENVLVPTLATPCAKPASADGQAAMNRAVRLLQRVGLGERLSHRPGQLSGGECQRVAVVRALINRPQLLLADEPTGALDHNTAEQLVQLLVELNREEDVTLIVVTHARELARRMGRVLELREGKLIAA